MSFWIAVILTVLAIGYWLILFGGNKLALPPIDRYLIGLVVAALLAWLARLWW